MATNTLTSLAILKVNIDQGKDYLDYLRPFIMQILVEQKPDPVTNSVISKHIRDRFGLEIPERTVQIVLKRISKRYSLKRDHGVYRITGDLPDPQITAKQSAAERHIATILGGLRQFSQDTMHPISSDEVAIGAICTFLAEFDVTCLRAYLRGTAIPTLERAHRTDIVLVSEYVQHVQRNEPERFNSFLLFSARAYVGQRSIVSRPPPCPQQLSERDVLPRYAAACPETWHGGRSQAIRYSSIDRPAE